MTHKTVEDAKNDWLCPMDSERCLADNCPMWRWRERQTTDAGWLDAVRAEADRTGEKAPFAKAARVVANAPEAHGMGPRTGFCGMAGKP